MLKIGPFLISGQLEPNVMFQNTLTNRVRLVLFTYSIIGVCLLDIRCLHNTH